MVAWIRFRIARWSAVAVGLGFAVAALRAEVQLAPLFTDGAVLQREKPIAIWGTADPREAVAVTFGGQTGATVTGTDGRWMIILDPMPAAAEGAALTVASHKNTIVVRDVLVGEVWLCSGQSNMEFTVDRVINAPQEIAGAQFPLIRHVKIQRHESDAPSAIAPTSGWQPATPEHVGSFTAVGYFFAREIHVKLRVPIGIVHSSWGGTPVESWLSPAALASNPDFAVVNERWRRMVANYPQAKTEYEKTIAAWVSDDNAARALGEKGHADWLK